MSMRPASIAPFSRAWDGPQPYQGRPVTGARVALRRGPGRLPLRVAVEQSAAHSPGSEARRR